MSHHELREDEWVCSHPLVFVMDELADPLDVKKEGKGRGKNKKKPAFTSKNFGAQVQIPAVKEAKALTLAWRCRQLGSFACRVA